MISLHKQQYSKVFSLYKENGYFFPLIGAVLEGKQNGVVYCDKEHDANAFYVEHRFGFAQVFGAITDAFMCELFKYLFEEKKFLPQKIRLYDSCFSGESVDVTSFIEREPFISSATLSYRQRFFSTSLPLVGKNKFDIQPATLENMKDIEKCFSVTTRFWSNEEDFLRFANAMVLFENDKPASICYAAAVSNNFAEIDIMTLAEYQHQGYAKAVAISFMQACHDKKISPLWDCFTNNAGSMHLCKSLGFQAKSEPYQFLTINK